MSSEFILFNRCRETTNGFPLRLVHNEEQSAETQEQKSADWIEMSSTRNEEISSNEKRFVQRIDEVSTFFLLSDPERNLQDLFLRITNGR
jgi:hypothetical protein